MEKISIKYFISPFLLLLIVKCAFAQYDTGIQAQYHISLQQYLSNVAKGNLGYITGQFNVSIAEATLKASKVFPDPEISIAFSNNEDDKLQMGQGIETGISYPFSLGNKRRAAIAVSKSQFELAQAVLEAYFQNLKADATRSFFVAMKEQQIFRLHEDTYLRMKELAKADSIRFVNGEITEIDALQSALEAKTQLNQVVQSKAEMQNMFINLSMLQGKTHNDTLYIPSGDFLHAESNFILSELLQTALKKRADIQIAIKTKDISEETVRLIKANRAFEFSLDAGYSYNSIVKNEIAPAPAYNSYSAGISIPLKFSDLNKGDLRAAKYAVNQYETIYQEAELQIVSEVTQAYNIFKAREKQMEYNKQGLVEDAEKILKGRIYLYQRGECGLVDVLNAQHTFNDLRMDYYNTMYEYSAALIELERSAAIQ